MILSFAIVVTWFSGMCLYFAKKQLPFLVNAIIYIISVICFTNYTTILTMNLHRFKTTDDPVNFIVFILYREFIIPFILIIFVNYFIYSRWNFKLKSLLTALVIMETVDVFLIKAKIISYLHWSLIQELIFNFLFLFFGFALAKILLALKKKEAIKYDNRL